MPATVIPVGFCCVEVKPPGPVHEKVAATGAVAKRLTEPPAQAGPLFDALGAANGGQTPVVDALPVIDAVTVSVAVMVCAPEELSVTLNVCVPLSPATKV